jgi:hypothetical protein
MGDTESLSDIFSVSNITFLVFLGLGFGLPPVDYEMEVEVGHTALRCDGVSGVEMVTLTHLKGPGTLLPCLRQADLGERRTMMQYDEEGVRAPFLEVALPSFSLDLERRHGGAALHPSSSMELCCLHPSSSMEFKVPAVDSLRWRIRNPQAGSGGAKFGEAVAWCLWCHYVESRSDGGGRFSLSPTFL